MPTSEQESPRGQALGEFLKPPIFQPSAEQFSNPLHFLGSVRQPSEATGLCKLVLPLGWTPSQIASQEGLSSFQLAAQALQYLQDLPSSRGQKAAVFNQQYTAFLERQGKSLKKAPIAGGRDVDLSLLYRIVNKRGGFASVSDSRGWKQVASAMQASAQGPKCIENSCPIQMFSKFPNFHDLSTCLQSCCYVSDVKLVCVKLVSFISRTRAQT